MNPIKIPLSSVPGERVKVKGALPACLSLLGCLLLTLLATAAHADIFLDGHQHIGDNESAAYTPSDPVTLAEFDNNPSRFHLTQDIQVTAVRLENLISQDPTRRIRVKLNNNTQPAILPVNGLITFSSQVTLLAGFRSLALDPGCLRNGQEFGSRCREGRDDEFDISFSAITLITANSSQITLSVNLNQRRHLGDTFDYRGNNDFANAYYPDAPEGGVLNIPFALNQNLRLYEVDFFRLRDGASSGQFNTRARVSVINSTFNTTVCDLGDLNFSGNLGPPPRFTADCFLPMGSYFLRVTAGQMKGTTTESDKGLDDISWKDLLLLLTPDVSGLPGRFNALDPDQLNVVNGIIRTKIAGASLGIDIVALDNGMLVPSYDDTVNVELLDATDDSGGLDGSGCRSTWLLTRVFIGILKFELTDGGRKSLPLGMEVAAVYPKARLLITDAQSPQIYGCSTDAFAVRPATFSLQVSDQTPETPDPGLYGTGRDLNNLDANAANPIHKAGQPFTIRATALNADGAVTPGYSGSPSVQALSSLLGAAVGEARGGSWNTTSGVAQTDEAGYSEAGAFVLEVRDTTFTAVDAADTSAEQRQIAPTTINVGRFVPDHFNVSVNTPEFEHGCGSFTYMGQSFKYRPGFEPQTTLTAVAFGAPPTATRNYTGDLYKLPKLPDNFLPGVSAYTAFGQALDTSAVPVPDNSVSELGDGVVLLTFTGTGMVFPRPNAPVVPFDADIQFTRTIVDSDGITTEPTPVQFGLASGGNGIAFIGGAKQVRFGRLVLDNAYGSERLPLDVPLRAEYWNSVGGSSGFVHNIQDNCTSLPQANAVLSGGISANTSVSATPDPIPLVAGKGAIRLTAPSPSATGQVTVTADLTALLLPWLWIDGDGNNNYNEAASADPSSQANFGVFKNNERRIYQREMVR